MTSDRKILQDAADRKSSCEDTGPLEKREEEEPGRKLEQGAQGCPLSHTSHFSWTQRPQNPQDKRGYPGPITLVPAVPWLAGEPTYSVVPVWFGRDDSFVLSLL